jgi:hypothetical protein
VRQAWLHEVQSSGLSVASPLDRRWTLAADAVLVAAIAVDVGLSVGAFLTPATWFSVLHRDLAPDALHVTFLQRCGAQWFAFAVLQLFTLAVWRGRPRWLAVVAGARISDLLTDLTYLSVAPKLAPGAAAMLVPPCLLNLGMAAVLLLAHTRIGTKGPATLEPA